MAEHTTDIGAKEIWYLTDSAMVAAAITRAAVGLDHVKIVRFAKNTATEP